MKKNLLILLLFVGISTGINAQLLYQNGPLVTNPGAGSGGADVSAVNPDLQIVYGFRQSRFNGFRVADDFGIPDASGWAIDSIVFFGYQTGSGNFSTFSDYRLQIWDGSPDNVVSTVVYGDTTTNVLTNSYWSGIYRTDQTGISANVDRPLMRNVIATPGLTLPLGAFWLDWGAFGTTASGPWVPPISFASNTQTVTGDAIQFSGVTGIWQPIMDTNLVTLNPDAQGLPFEIFGTIISGINQLPASSYIQTNVYPNPIQESATVTISDAQKNATYTFLVYDALGKVVIKKENIVAHNFELNRNNLSSGIYQYRVLKNGKFISKGKLMFE